LPFLLLLLSDADREKWKSVFPRVQLELGQL
jgi:hypothetical protein